jgi:hypothetical protein
MVLGFKQQFEAKILSKEKRHTIRAKRKGKRQWRAGDICDCYGDARQKTMHLLGRWPCTRVQDIRIRLARRGDAPEFRGMPIVSIDNMRLSVDERESLAHSDGFESFADMMEFWRGRLPFHGDMIHWDPDRPQDPPRSGRNKAKPKRPAKQKVRR